MDDEDSSSGMGTLAAFALGRMSAANEQAESNFARSVVRRLVPQAPTVDVGALMDENAALRAELARTSKSLREYQQNYARLREWADLASVELQEHRARQK